MSFFHTETFDEEPLPAVQVGPALTVTVVTLSAPTVVLLADRSLSDFLVFFFDLSRFFPDFLEALTLCKYLLAALNLAEDILLLRVESHLGPPLHDKSAVRHFLAVRFAALALLLLTRRRYFLAPLTCCLSFLDMLFLPLAVRRTARALLTLFCSFWVLSSFFVQEVGVGVAVMVTVLEGSRASSSSSSKSRASSSPASYSLASMSSKNSGSGSRESISSKKTSGSRASRSTISSRSSRA